MPPAPRARGAPSCWMFDLLSGYQVIDGVMHGTISFDGPEWYSVSGEARDLCSKLLDRNCFSRISANEALRHPWIQKLGPARRAGEERDALAVQHRAIHLVDEQELERLVLH